ncbi:EstA family serine hydrolase [Marmoricola sp. URHB0036]|uniref:EstA family serine hydrolase n=1 Tax=Marmoricola sp. URHB0036 TaxID=1298863 RepID=UPI00041C6B8B|nr:EstA family serine hydrolase [Marmoricola sp. URHB0036]
MAELRGAYDERFAAVAEALRDALDAGDAGGSAAVFVGGEPVVDVWGGQADARNNGSWERDTIVNVFSVTKTMTALCALILVDRGLLDPDAPVAGYWPEFAVEGKSGVLVRHVLAHTAGLPDWEAPVADLYDWTTATGLLAASAPQWEPGTAVGYHSLTQGFLVGELVRRITDRSIGEFFAAEVAAPLGADFWIGLPAEHDHRVAATVPPTGRDEDYVAGSSVPGAPATKATPMSVRAANSTDWRRSEIPAASGFGNARSVALVQSVMACGGTVGGIRLLGPETCELAWAEQFSGEDRVLGMSVSWGLGYGRLGGVYGWGGWGGALVMIDPTQQLVVAYATNQMREPAEDDRGMQIAMAALGAV